MMGQQPSKEGHDMTAHRITYVSKYGALQMGRVYGAPDCDSAAIWLGAKYAGSSIRAVDAINENAARFWGEHDLGQFAR
jgi:hypothetical protein